MDEIIQETLSKGVELHLAGKFDLASQLYASVIKLQPEHADANHNMGLLKIDTGNATEALPYLQTALQVDSSITQFWLSYVNALIALERLDEASRILSLAKENGIDSEELLKLDQQLSKHQNEVETYDPDVETLQAPKSNIFDTMKLENVLNLAKKKIKEGSTVDAQIIYQDILEKFPKNKKAQQGLYELKKIQRPHTTTTAPNDAINRLINLIQQGK